MDLSCVVGPLNTIQTNKLHEAESENEETSVNEVQFDDQGRPSNSDRNNSSPDSRDV